MATNLRYLAIETLCQVERLKVPVSPLLDRAARSSVLPGRDRQLVMKIVYGVLRNRDYLDRLITQLCRRPGGRMKPFVRQALRSGLFQIFFLDRIPPSAAVNETVKALKEQQLPTQVQGFVNCVLRESIRRRTELPTPEEPDEHGRALLNHPSWLTERWQKRYGDGAMRHICRHNNREQPLCLRTDSSEHRQQITNLLHRLEIEVNDGRYAPGSLLISNYRGTIGELDTMTTGAIQVQGQASQLTSLLLAPFTSGCSVLDGCAGLGGKTFHLSCLMNTVAGGVTAVEPDPRRYRLLQQNLAKCEYRERIETYNLTLQEFAHTRPERYDRILIDAPCSGTGVIGKHPDIRWNRSEDDLARYAARQRTLLNKAAGLLAPGGVLVYATCSIEAEENEEVVEGFLQQHKGFRIDDCSRYLPASCGPLIRGGCLAPLPHNGIDGFFGARLTRRE
jgi:16S rRNA (cytosine967-C5)-methyltransferase